MLLFRDSYTSSGAMVFVGEVDNKEDDTITTVFVFVVVYDKQEEEALDFEQSWELQ